MAISNSGWTEVRAVFRKEAVSELRGRHGVVTSLLFAFMTVTALGVAAARTSPTPSLAAGMLWAALLFAAITGLVRTFVTEEDQGTGDLLRLWAKPGAVFWGKFLYNGALIVLVAAIVAPLFALFVGVSPHDWALAVAAIFVGCVALAAAISLCGALVARAEGHGALAGVISIPVLLPVVFLGVGALRIAFGEPGTSGWVSVAGLVGLGAAFVAAGPYLFAAVWKQ
ncbi:MAG TPA: heme exporter protein CcmB [Fimbriimonadales bacterium]|nr:heme exporter protein CcmB [Fimbriimonadales bacterium]